MQHQLVRSGGERGGPGAQICQLVLHRSPALLRWWTATATAPSDAPGPCVPPSVAPALHPCLLSTSSASFLPFPPSSLGSLSQLCHEQPQRVHHCQAEGVRHHDLTQRAAVSVLLFTMCRCRCFMISRWHICSLATNVMLLEYIYIYIYFCCRRCHCCWRRRWWCRTVDAKGAPRAGCPGVLASQCFPPPPDLSAPLLLWLSHLPTSPRP